jgi:hypothetical protein
MFRAILFTQWKWTRALLLPLVIVTFAVPIYSVQQFSDASLSRWQVSSILSTMQAWGMGYMIGAMFTGLVVAAAAWSFDLKGRHVYALSLPLPRWHYVLLRYVAGVLLLLVPAFFLWLGSLLATSSAVIPLGLHAYPTALALRFLLASFIIFSVMFAVTIMPKKVGIGLPVVLGAIFMLDLFIHQVSPETKLIGSVFDWAVRWPGFLEVYFGRWMLIDV